MFHFVQSVCSREARLVLDPVLLLSPQEWEQIVDFSAVRVPQDPFLLYYHLYRRQSSSVNRKAIADFASKHNLRVVEILGFPQNTDEVYRFSCCGPATFMALIKHSSMVVTSSYHGCLFSILYHKSFFVSLPQGVDRMNSVLDLLGMCECCIPISTQELPKIPMVDYDAVESWLTQLRTSYLDEAMNK